MVLNHPDLLRLQLSNSAGKKNVLTGPKYGKYKTQVKRVYRSLTGGLGVPSKLLAFLTHHWSSAIS